MQANKGGGCCRWLPCGKLVLGGFEVAGAGVVVLVVLVVVVVVVELELAVKAGRPEELAWGNCIAVRLGSLLGSCRAIMEPGAGVVLVLVVVVTAEPRFAPPFISIECGTSERFSARVPIECRFVKGMFQAGGKKMNMHRVLASRDRANIEASRA